MRKYIIKGSDFLCLVAAPSFEHAMKGFYKLQPDAQVLMVIEITCGCDECSPDCPGFEESDPIEQFIKEMRSHH